MNAVELHSAFVWDCDECGRENFERAVEGNIDEAALGAAENQVVGELVAPRATEADDGMMEAEYLVTRICIAPGFVKCRECGANFPTEIATADED